MQISIIGEEKGMKKIQPDTYTAVVRKAYSFLKANKIEVTAISLEKAIATILAK
jgi:hypothetical protein